jgi:alanine-synthesizing transaminase
MRHCDSAIDTMAAEYQTRRDALCDGLRRIGWNPIVPKAGMFVWSEIPEPWKKMGSIEFAMKLLNEGGVAVSPGRGFGPKAKASCVWRSSKTASVFVRPCVRSTSV